MGARLCRSGESGRGAGNRCAHEQGAGEIPVGQQPQALVYVPDAIASGDGISNLVSLGEAGTATHLALAAPSKKGGSGAKATVSVNSLGAIDLLQIAVTGLQAVSKYTLWIADSRTPPFEHKEALATFNTNVSGAAVVQAVGPFRRALSTTEAVTPAGKNRRFLLVTAHDSDTPVLIDANPNELPGR